VTSVQTRNGTATRTAGGWLWICEHCTASATLGIPSDLEGFDVPRWAQSVDAVHWCEHKR